MELGRLLRLLPEEMRSRVTEHHELHQLIEVVMDLGRKPLARFPSGDFVLSDNLITVDDLQHATSLVNMIVCLLHTTCLIYCLNEISSYICLITIL